MMFHKVHRKVDKAGKVKSIEPDDRFVISPLLVSALLAMVVPVP
jgi:hypothetical protein